MIFRPALRLATGPLPPGDLAARDFAAVIRPPLLFLAIAMNSLVEVITFSFEGIMRPSCASAYEV
jgi:hypothetical protein